MKLEMRFLLCAALAFITAYSTAGVATARQKSSAKDIEITQAWAMPTIGAAKASVIYFTITNLGSMPAHLVGIKTPAAENIEIHYTEMTDNVMRMHQVDTLTIASGQSFDFKPGGYHLMLHGIASPLKVGDIVPVSLEFEQAGMVEINVPVTGKQPIKP